jgi:hypothetical protein
MKSFVILALVAIVSAGNAAKSYAQESLPTPVQEGYTPYPGSVPYHVLPAPEVYLPLTVTNRGHSHEAYNEHGRRVTSQYGGYTVSGYGSEQFSQAHRREVRQSQSALNGDIANSTTALTAPLRPSPPVFAPPAQHYVAPSQQAGNCAPCASNRTCLVVIEYRTDCNGIVTAFKAARPSDLRVVWWNLVRGSGTGYHHSRFPRQVCGTLYTLSSGLPGISTSCGRYDDPDGLPTVTPARRR